MLEDVDDFELVLPFELLLANAPKVGDGRGSARARARDEQPQQILGQGFLQCMKYSRAIVARCATSRYPAKNG
ncbi:MAG: hypothetical protein JWL61_2531 [Gemmatimonadetes bacterium]|nr:hypothetical protein [Gemmatimonadota bacterium]